MSLEKILLVKPRGFCAGVDMAVKVVEDCIDYFGKPVYVKHEIVHNKHVVNDLKNKGAITVNSVDEIPDNSIAVFSAHGSPPEHYKKAREKNIRLIDATCPLVTKVHLEIHKFADQGYNILYIGHRNHVEAQGILGELPGEINLVENVEEVYSLDIGNPEKIIYLTQTTLSIDDTKDIVNAIKEKYPHVSEPPKEDICYATTNRQGAVKELAKRSDLVFIIGSINSSNSNRLVETAKNKGTPAYLIDDVSCLDKRLLDNVKTVGISSGASVPDYLVQEFADYLSENYGAKKEEVILQEEKINFKEPIELTRAKREYKQ